MEEKDYEKIKAEYEAAMDAALVAWAQTYFTGAKKPDMKDVYVIGDVTDRAAEDIRELTGSDVAGFRHVLRSDVVRHVQKRHGMRGAADHSMEDLCDLGRIGYVLRNYDEIIVNEKSVIGFKDKNNNNAVVLNFVKRVDGHIYTAEAVTDSAKKKTLYVLSMYKAKTSKKRERASNADSEESPLPDVRNVTRSSVHSIPQNVEKVNMQREENSKNFKAFCKKHKSVSGNKFEVQRHPTEKGKGK